MKPLDAFAVGLAGYLMSLAVHAPMAKPITPEQALNQFEQRLEQLSSPHLPISPSPPLPYSPTLLPSHPPAIQPTTPSYIIPAKGTLTSGYGWRWGRMHKGIDIAGPTGTPIVAAADGRVQFAAWNSGGYGYLIEILHSDGSMTRYAHNSTLLVQRGDLVEQGQAIALMGSTGYSTGPHCHFEIHPTGKGAVNPVAYLGRSRAQGL